MYYSDISSKVNNRLSKLEKFGLNKVLHSDWLGFIIITNSGKVLIDCAYDYENIGGSNIVSWVTMIENDIFNLKGSKTFSIDNYNLIVTPIWQHDFYRIFFISCSLHKKYNKNDMNITDLITNISYENVQLNNEIVKERNYLENIFESTDSAIVSINLQGEITKVNTKVYDLVGIKNEDITGRKIYEYISKKHVRILKNEINCMMCDNKSNTHKDIIFVNKLEKKIVLNITMSPLKVMPPLSSEENHVPAGIVFVITDVTKTKVLERELEQIKQITLLGDISSDIAHEIKNPLMGIRGCARILQKNINKNSKQYEFAESIVSEADRANNAIEQFLSYARMNKEDSNTLVDINEVLNKCIDLMFFYKENKCIVVNQDLDEKLPPIKGNIVRLQQAFINILINSIQAIKTKGKITVKTRYLNKDKQIVVEICDNGIGINKDKIHKVFEPYFTTKRDGVGLGLSITKKIIEKNGGEIYVSSQEKSWTKFKVTFSYKEMIN